MTSLHNKFYYFILGLIAVLSFMMAVGGVRFALPNFEAERYGWFFLFGFTVLFFVRLGIDRRILSRLKKLRETAEEISQKSQTTLRLPVEGGDEISRLSVSLNAMLQTLDEREKRLTQIAFYDSQTGLPNKHCLMEELESELSNLTTKPNYTFCVAFANIDQFRLINEDLGPRDANLVLAEIVERARGMIAGFASIFRVGGDEFCMILRGIASQDYVKVLQERLQRVLAMPISVGGKTFSPTVRFGTVLGIRDTSTPEQIFSLGTEALSNGKKNGTGSIVFTDASAQSSLHQETLSRARAAIQKALESSEIIAYFQPIYELSPLKLSGFEALARWIHPQQGFLPPAMFIHQAEEAGLISEIDRHIIRQTIETAKKWLEAYPEIAFSVSVNASGASFRDLGFVPFILDTLERNALDPRYFVLEAKESIFIDELNSVREKMTQLRSRGVKIAFDDFGTGYSSLQYLGQLPVDIIKIDKSFIDQIFTSTKGELTIQSAIKMANDQGFYTIAEGVESENQLHWLMENDVKKGQGYFFSRPVSSEEAEHLLADAVLFENLRQ